MIESISFVDACKPFIMGVGGGFVLSAIPAMVGFVINKLYRIMQKGEAAERKGVMICQYTEQRRLQ